jgi:hypothetical protein
VNAAALRVCRLLAVIRQNLLAGSAQLFSMLLKASQHSEITLIKHRTAVPLYIAVARALLLFGAAVLRYRGGSWNEKRKTGGNSKIFDHRNLR